MARATHRLCEVISRVHALLLLAHHLQPAQSSGLQKQACIMGEPLPDADPEGLSRWKAHDGLQGLAGQAGGDVQPGEAHQGAEAVMQPEIGFCA